MSAPVENNDSNPAERVAPSVTQLNVDRGILAKRAKLDEEAPLSQVEVVVENVDQMAASYVRTRHKNVRCFPRCGPVHKSKSFCGHSVYVLVKGDGLRKEDVIVVGEFRNIRTAPSFAVGQVVPIENFDECFTEGVLLKQEGPDLSFAINPIRKWKFDGKIRPMDHYVFTVFAIVGGKVMAKTDTPSFTITPIWKTEGKDDGEEEEEPATKTNPASSFPRRSPKSGAPRSEPALAAPVALPVSRVGVNILPYPSQNLPQQLLVAAPPFLQQNLMFPMNSGSIPRQTPGMPSVALPSFMQQPLQVSAPYGMLPGQMQSPRSSMISSSPTAFISQQRPSFQGYAADPRAIMYGMIREADFQQKPQAMDRVQLAPVHAVPAATQLVVAPRAPFPAHFMQIHKNL